MFLFRRVNKRHLWVFSNIFFPTWNCVELVQAGVFKWKKVWWSARRLCRRRNLRVRQLCRRHNLRHTWNRRTTRARVRVSSVYSTCDAGFRRRQSRRRRQSFQVSSEHFSSTFLLRHINYVNGFYRNVAPKTFHRKQNGHAFFVLRSFIKQNVSLTDRWRCVFKLYWHHVEINVSYIFY